jgi:outer membrane protein assembly factor BamB
MLQKCLLFLAILAASCGEAAEWPQYRGPAGSGVAAGVAPVEFGPHTNLLWSAATASGHSSPSIWGDKLYLTTFDAAGPKLELVALDRAKGGVRWRQTIPAQQIEKVHAVSSPATATPVVDGERVYVYFGSAGLYCYDLAGKLVWSVPMPTASVSFGSGTSPVLAGDALVLVLDHGDRRMLALDRKTGKQLWEVKLASGMNSGFAGHATPLVWKDQVILHRAGEVGGYSLKDGSRLWWVSVYSQGTGTPVIHGDTLFVGAWGNDPDLKDPVPSWEELLQKYDKDSNGTLSATEFPADLAVARRVDAGNTPGAIVTFKQFFGLIDMNKDGQIAKNEWEFVLKMIVNAPPVPSGLLAIRLGGEKDVTKSNVVWREERAVPEVPVPLVYRDRVYTVTNGGIVSVFDEASGKLIYRARLGAGGLYYSSPVAAGDYVYFASGEGMLTAIRAGDKLEVAARNDFGEPIFATPAIMEGKMYVRTAGHLYACGK